MPASRSEKFRGSGLLFYLTIASLIIPSIAISLGIALQFRLLDETIKWLGQTFEIQWIVNDFQTSMGLIASGLGTHLTWTLPFGLLIMFAVFNRFNPSYEEAARDLGATPWQTFLGCCFPANSSRPCGCRVVRIHAQLRRARALVAGFGFGQYAAVRAERPNDNGDQPIDIRVRGCDHRGELFGDWFVTRSVLGTPTQDRS